MNLFDDETGERLIQLVQSFQNNKDLLAIIFQDLSAIRLKTSFSFWLQIFDVNSPIVQQQALFAFNKTVQDNTKDFSQLPKQSILQGNRPAHENRVLTKAVTQLTTEIRLSIVGQIVPVIDDEKPDISTIVNIYVEEVWKSLDDRPECIRILYETAYLKLVRGRHSIRTFISRLWEESQSSERISLFDYILQAVENRKPNPKTRIAVAELIAHLLETVSQKSELMEMMLVKFGELPSNSNTWSVLADACGGYLTRPDVIFPSSNPSVVMVQTTQNGNSNDRLISPWHIRALYNRRIWNTVNPLMGTRVVEVVDVLAHQPA